MSAILIKFKNFSSCMKYFTRNRFPNEAVQVSLAGNFEKKLILIKEMSDGIFAIKDYCNLHINRRSTDDVQYIAAIEEKCNELINLLNKSPKQERAENE